MNVTIYHNPACGTSRNTLDLSAVPVVKQLSHLPIIVDPSHGVGIRDKVAPLALAAVAVGADGLGAGVKLMGLLHLLDKGRDGLRVCVSGVTWAN